MPTPVQHYVKTAEDIKRILKEIDFPCVVKPSRSRLHTGTMWLRTSVRRVQCQEDLLALIHNSEDLRYPFSIQREIIGDGYGIFCLCDHGQRKVFFAHHRLREKPPWGGASVLRESIPLDQRMKEYATRLLQELDWHGVAMVEFKKDMRTGVPYLMEVNGRFWGSLQLAIDAGINFPLQLVQLYKGGLPLETCTYRVGVRSRWLLGDLDHLLTRLFSRSSSTNALPPISTVISDFMCPHSKNTYLEVERWDDLGPCLYEMRNYIREGFGLNNSSRRRRYE